jgi:hypothetical protein
VLDPAGQRRSSMLITVKIISYSYSYFYSYSHWLFITNVLNAVNIGGARINKKLILKMALFLKQN